MVAALGSLFGSAAKRAAEKEAARKTAEAAAKFTAQKAGAMTAQHIADEAAKQLAIKTAAALAAKEAEALAVKTAEAAAAAAAKSAAERAALVAAASAGATIAGADAAKIAQSKAGTLVTKGASDLAKESEGAAKTIGKQASGDAKKASESFLSKNPKLVVGGVAVATLAAAATVKFEASNNKKLTITATAPMSDGTGTQITFTPALDILKTDKLDISGTNSNPSIDGSLVPIVKVISKTQVVIGTPSSTSGTTGQLVNHTSFEGQITNTMVEAGGAVIGAGLKVGGGALDAGFKAAGLPTPSAMLAKLASYKYYILAVLLAYLALKFWPRGGSHSLKTKLIRPDTSATYNIPARMSLYPTSLRRSQSPLSS